MPRITLGNVTIDRDRFEVWVDVRRADLTSSSSSRSYTPARNAGKVISRPKLMQAFGTSRRGARTAS